jgi:hypothetical protein
MTMVVVVACPPRTMPPIGAEPSRRRSATVVRSSGTLVASTCSVDVGESAGMISLLTMGCVSSRSSQAGRTVP